jgi:tRNA wybutosine-synthesizing protein 1
MPQQRHLKECEKSGYRIIGKNKHSAVEVCRWCKSVLKGGKGCYKQAWFSINSHRCVQMTPSLICNLRCQFCWRRFGLRKNEIEEWDEPKHIVDEAMSMQKRLLMGFGGNPKTSKGLFKESLQPKQFAISLDGEPTLYPKLPEMIKEIKSRGCTVFLVTNGTMPSRLKKLIEKTAEPTNLYISVYGTSEKMYKKVCNPLIPNVFDKVKKSLKLMKKFREARTVFRITAVKNLTMVDPEGYSKLIKMSEPDFVEIKGYAWLGESRQRLKNSNVPTMDELGKFAKSLKELTGYSIKAEDERSRVILLSKK